MSLGYDKRLFLVAFDHRASFEKGLFGATPPLSASVRDGIIKAKEIIFEANQLAIEAGAPRDLSGILVDEEFGTTVARRAKEAGVPLAMPAERSGQSEFELQYGAAFGEHIESFDPTFVKVLVRYNPQGDADLNKRQTERLAILSECLQARHHKFLFELLIPPTTAQLNSLDGHEEDYDRKLRPKLVVEAIASLHAAVQGFSGFAVGRTLWNDALSEHIAGKSSQLETARTIASRYRTLIEAYETADTK